MTNLLPDLFSRGRRENTFAIVATVRNEVSTIEAFVESLLAQRRAPEEIVIVDGCSTDGTLALLRTYEARGLLRLVVRDCNIAQGRNHGIAAASSTHIAVTDAGCNVDKDWLQHIADCFDADNTIDVVAGNFRFETRSAFEHAVVLATFQPRRDESDTARFYPSSRSVAFRKSAWNRAGGYPEWLYAAEDTLFNIRLRQVGCEFRFCREAVVRWRPRETWRALARQRINFARGNARIGIGSSGYRMNLRIHTLIMGCVLISVWVPLALVGAGAVAGWHLARHLWPQARTATEGLGIGMSARVLAVMEFVRIVSLWGYLRGRWDRARDASFIDNQQRYMDVASVEELEWV